MQIIEQEDYIKYINDYAHKDSSCDFKKNDKFSIKNNIQSQANGISKTFRTGKIGKMTRNIFATVKFRFDIWQYIPQFNPVGRFRIIWDIFIAFSTLYLFFSISISLAFAKLSLLNYLPFFIIMFSIGILIDLNTGFYEQGIFIMNRKLIVINYLKKYFIFDLISTGCLFIQAFSNGLDYIIILFFLKANYFSKITKIFNEVLHFKPIFQCIVSFFKLVSVIIFAAHFFGCIFISVVTYSSFHQNWIEQQKLSLDQTFRVYIRAFYYSCITMLTVGYGDVTPQNDLEYGVVIITVLIGCMFFGYSLNKIGTIFNEIEEQDKKILKNLLIINQYMTRKDIQKDLQFQIREYLTYYWSQNNTTENKAQEQIISQLSDGLKQKLQIQATRKVLNQCPIFRYNFSEEFLQKASSLIKEYRCYPDEIITFQGDVDDCSLFFVEQGAALMYFQGGFNYLGKNDTSVNIKELQKGDSFGFHSFFTGQSRKLTIKSVGFTSLLLIERAPFIKLIKQYQEDYEIYCTISDNLLTGQYFKQVHSYCYSCNNSNHMITECPNIHLVINKVELSKRNFNQVRNKNVQRNNERKRAFLDENEALYFIQEENTYLQAYHQLFVGVNLEEEDDENFIEMIDNDQTSDDRASIAQSIIKISKNSSSQMVFDESGKQKRSYNNQQKNQEKKFPFLNSDLSVTKQIEESQLINEESNIITSEQIDQSQPSQKQINRITGDEKKKKQILSLPKTKNSYFSVSDDQFCELDKLQYQMQFLQQNYDKIQSQNLIQQIPQSHNRTLSQTMLSSTQIQQQQNKQQSIQYILQENQNQISQQTINQQINQLLQSSKINSKINIPSQIPQLTQNFPSGGWQITPQIASTQRRGSQTQKLIPLLNIKQNFPKSLQQLQDLTVYPKTQVSLPYLNIDDQFFPGQTQYKQNKTLLFTNQSSLRIQQRDRLALLQQLNDVNAFFSESNQEDCKMKIYNNYFPDWNFNIIIQKVNSQNGISVNSSETDHQDKIKQSSKQNKPQQFLDQIILNKRITNSICQNDYEKKVQNVLISLNQARYRNIEEAEYNEPNSFNHITHNISNKKKGSQYLIPNIQEQNHKLAALKFNHQQSNNQNKIQQRKKYNSKLEQEKQLSNQLIIETINSTQENVSMYKQSNSLDTNMIKMLKPSDNVNTPQFSEQNIQVSKSQKNILNTSFKNKNLDLTLDNSGNNIDFAENIAIDENNDTKSSILINQIDKQNNYLNTSYFANNEL